MKLALIFLFTIYQIWKCDSENSELKHVQIVFRHGDRAPISIFSTDTNRENKWPYGLSKLTKQGIIQHFQLGLWLRRRYNEFLGKPINYSFISIRSSDVDRTLMSAESNLAGLFYNSSEEIIAGLKWHPFPIHTQLMKSDILLHGDGCPIYEDLYKKTFTKSEFQDKLKPYESTLKLLREKTGIKDLSFSATWKIYDTLFCEMANNLTVDEWVTKEVWKNLSNLNNIDWEIINHGILSKIVGGYLLHTIIEQMDFISQSKPLNNKGSKFIMYSGHDTNIASLASLLGIYNNIQPPYTSCILFELHYIRSRKEKWAVRVLYKNFTDSSGTTNISAALIPGCKSSLCHLSDFMKVLKNRTWSQEQYNNKCYKKTNILFIIQVLFGIVTVILVLFIIVMFFIRVFVVPRYPYTRVSMHSDIN